MIICIFVFGGTIGDAYNPGAGGIAGKSRLAPCPKTPNCVSSKAPMDKHYVAPLRYTGNKDEAYRKLVDLISSQQRAQVVAEEANYLRAEFKSALFGFVDDVEFIFSEDQPVIDVRSASRVGYYDFGVNRRRVEHIRNQWNHDVYLSR